MQIYPLSLSWFVYVFLACTLIVEIKKNYMYKTMQTKKDFIKKFNLFVIVFWILYKLILSIDPTYDFNIWGELPFHLCNISCILFLIASIKDWDLLRGLCFFTGTLGIFFAFMMPDANFIHIHFLSFKAIGYWGYHALMLVQSVSLITLNIIRPTKKDVTHIVSLLALLCLAIHGLNVVLRATVFDQTNYFYTFGIDGNIITDFLLQKIPYPFLFLVPILLPLWIVCVLISKMIETIKNKEELI